MINCKLENVYFLKARVFFIHLKLAIASGALYAHVAPASHLRYISFLRHFFQTLQSFGYNF